MLKLCMEVLNSCGQEQSYGSLVVASCNFCTRLHDGTNSEYDPGRCFKNVWPLQEAFDCMLILQSSCLATMCYFACTLAYILSPGEEFLCCD
mmetsp:Transcript_54605/g.97968  ORF Transcript_54605/g.97968 Transcript_54605/m.97968 type:complete len:92 (-) Transcript_54605:490-765(-)